MEIKDNMQPRLERWENRLRSITTQSLTTDYVRPTEETRIVEAIHNVALPEATRTALLQLAILDGSHSVSPFTVLLAAFAVLAARLTGDEDISIGTSGETKEPFVLRLPIDPKTSFADLLERVKNLESEGTADAVPLLELIQYLQNKSKAPKPPRLFNLSLYYAPDAPSQQFLASHELQTDLSIYVELNSPPQVTNSLRFVPQIPEITLSAHYNQFIFSSKRISNMIDQLMQIVQIGAADPKIEIGSIPLMTEQQKAILPDPTRDLHWSEFRGPIHDIFSANAKKHPERECVVETADPHNPEGKKRVFTYQQIDEASNQLAHHFVAKGVKRGDVVMVYAYRGVDLVVSVMGVLKAGATFSNIYLQVAQPRALVVIEKAGKLSNTVRDYLNELHILTEVPALAIQADGNLLGGEIDGKDVLAEQVALKAEGTGVVVGPDSNPTLSFTSGSEGIPKGVRGRHFSLTYYFPWMAETFGLSENDRFTMLSGIAHDPIQRDIFTPLFLGAKLLVPTADDIGTPGRLAEWMDENGATITHLTPAMGQLLSAQAEHPIPSLHHAFFVGDILTKRDCLRLQGLARNCAVVNMYGTTETQRAVSYFEVPSLNADPTFSQSQKDVIAAGKGMLDVQLLVVNRHNRQQVCGVGEIGEIYVRAGGLAEGYLRLPDMTATKFINNWFVTEDHWKAKDVDNGEAWREFFMGPRDRMYRTGDLGRYTPDGNVECSGRADDQVKIRGFRIELGEIDTHLSQHPLVRENVTLVRRDKDEEPVLISYVVPLQSGDLDDLVSADEGSKNEDGQDDEIVKGLRRYRRLITEIKSYLKKRLPSYAVPTVVVPLAKLPLNPNGKVDKPALPFPDTAQLAAANRGRRRTGVNEEGLQLSPVQKQLKEVWQELLPHAAGSVSLTDNFFDLGGHSILATRMIFEIRKRFITDIALGAIFKHPTLAGLAQEIERIRTGGAHEMGIHNIANPELAIEEETPVEDYAGDARELAKALPASFLPSHDVIVSGGITVFLTGATGFLGAYLIRDLLRRVDPQVKKIIAHVRASDAAKGLERVKSSCNAYGVWDESWASRIEIATGSLGDDKLGMNDADYKKVVEEVDVIIHNGAQVHWVYPYSKLKGANVKGTIDALALCTEGKPKSFAFVSSTSVLDTDHYVKLSDTILEAGGAGVPESDDLEGSATGLGTGYGQSKWVGEFLVREAGKRGLDGCIIRPGYITGDSETGVTNTDDFLMRMVKGCAQLGKMPDIVNTVNMVPVDHVARVVVACAVSPPVTPLAVAQVTGHPRLRMNEFLATLATYGYDVQTVDYIPWRMALENYVMGESKDNALFPLLHFVLDDLPSGTKAPELADGNAVTALLEDAKWTKEDWSKGAGVSVEIMGVYIAYLIAIGFLPEPQGKGERELPKIQLTEEAKKSLASVGGRGGAA
ncbi:Similar to L-aminoadipate-semialdehyde dehydrogenase; acc. no. P40976 [Pyronema omphalodes CBS 100304]|uniref:Alpha-aminoadipate reductase n=1 Tax=Pyronema omphalodes (strain CBS 100304) TaxID=1076935 RepID=U4LLB6_PYROM|nr:Similar to L-aminoadipate-semialdehyde dehydrogenase; acc. no. P40976 [Pyronema omphalodes CBS 100304]